MYDLWTRICFCCAILRDVIIVERCSMNIMSTTCVLQNAVVCWVTAGLNCIPRLRTCVVNFIRKLVMLLHYESCMLLIMLLSIAKVFVVALYYVSYYPWLGLCMAS